MEDHHSTIFREEVLRHKASRLYGEVNVAIPLPWQMVGYLLLAAFVAGVAFLATTSYSHVETVSGVISLNKGAAAIVPSRPGIITSLAVTDGQFVHEGTVLARIRVAEDMLEGSTAPARMRQAVREQDAHLSEQVAMLQATAAADSSRLQTQIDGLASEVASLTNQITDQKRLVDLAEADYRSVVGIAANGFISRREMDARQVTILSRRQQLAQFEQSRSSKTAAIAEARRSIVQSEAGAKAQIAAAQSQRATLAQQITQADLAGGYSLTSPIEGFVTALTAHPGDPANAQTPLMIVIPGRSQQLAQLYMPTAAAGFVHKGQEVRLAIDAFPYQEFGTVRAVVRSVSSTTVLRQGPNGQASVYLVVAELANPWMSAFGRHAPLVPGMTATGRIVTDRRSLLKWLLEPFFAVRNR